MDPVQSWLDTDEVRRMAESLMAAPPKVDVSSIDAGYGDSFEGFADASHADTANSAGVHQPDGRPHAERQPISVSPLSTQNPSAPSASESEELATSPAEISPRAVMGNALADARRVAEGSGMLQASNTELLQADASSAITAEAAAPSPVPPVAPLEFQSGPIVSEPTINKVLSQHDSPFQLAVDQSDSSQVPVARQLSPALETPPPVIHPSVVTAPPAPNPAGFEDFPPDLTEETISEPEVEAARGPFLARLQQFSAILHRDLDARSMFLIDNEGQILLDEVENPKLIQVARTLANASYRASRQSSGSAAVANLHVKIGANATLEVIPVQSRYGLLILGVIFPSPIGTERVRQVADLLYSTVEPSL